MGYISNNATILAFRYYMTLWVGIVGIGLVVGREWENFMALPVGVSVICLVVRKEQNNYVAFLLNDYL